MADLREGLRRPLMKRRDREAIARAEAVAVHLMRAWAVGDASGGDLRRPYDPPGVRRLVVPGTVRVDDWHGLVAEVRGYLPNGDEDRGLHCNDCPLSDLEVVHDPRD